MATNYAKAYSKFQKAIKQAVSFVDPNWTNSAITRRWEYTAPITDNASPVTAGSAGWSHPFMRHLAEDLDELDGVNGVRIVRSAVELITALLSAEHLEQEPVATENAPVTMSAVRLYIEGTLDDPELNAAKVARAHFVSLRYLQYLFSQEGMTLSAYIRGRRLERCRLDLQEPGLDALSILQIAQSWGFTDPSHFSKVFKTAYGTGPRGYRAQFEPAASKPSPISAPSSASSNRTAPRPTGKLNASTGLWQPSGPTGRSSPATKPDTTHLHPG